jgi:uncharacterized membrane protein YcgQ (UPF0703/DUF1980 family)
MASGTLSKYVIPMLFHGSSGYANAPYSYVQYISVFYQTLFLVLQMLYTSFANSNIHSTDKKKLLTCLCFFRSITIKEEGN